MQSISIPIRSGMLRQFLIVFAPIMAALSAIMFDLAILAGGGVGSALAWGIVCGIGCTLGLACTTISAGRP